MIFDEELFPLVDLPKRLPKKRGKRLSKATGYRWKSVGLAGVKLEVAYIQGEAHTSLEAVDRFNRAVTEAKTTEPAVIPIPRANTGRTQSAHARAKRKLAAQRKPK